MSEQILGEDFDGEQMFLENASLDTEDRKQSQTEGSISKSGNENNHRTLTLHLPLDATNVQAKVYMSNSPWPNNCDLGSARWVEANPNQGEVLGWAKVRNLRIVTTSHNVTIRADFHNWSDCNLRHGKIVACYN